MKSTKKPAMAKSSIESDITTGQNKTIIGQFQGKCCDSNIFNNNDMKLGKELFETLFSSEEYKRAIDLGHYIGFLGHPEDPNCMDFEHACIVMKECHINPNGEIEGTFDLIDTPVGRVVKAFIDGGVTFGISIRGAGDVDASGEVDPETFIFRGFDLVTFPAYDDCIPEFTEIAASTDPNKKKKYMTIYNTMKKELSSIKSHTALEELQNQFHEGSEIYQDIATQLDEVDEDLDEAEMLDEELDNQRIEGLIALYKEKCQEVKDLEAELIAEQEHCEEVEIRCARKFKVYNRINACQMRDLEDKVAVEAQKYRKSVLASEKLKSSARSLNEDLNRMKKVTASKELQFSNMQAEIGSLQSELDNKDKEIAKLSKKNASLQASLEASDTEIDDKLKEAEDRIAACEQLVLDYQEAYANLYASALGIRFDNLSITASTSVEELKSMISGSTSTAGIPAMPSMELDDEEAIPEAASFGLEEYGDLITI